MKGFGKRLFSLLTVLTLLISCLPISGISYAEGESEEIRLVYGADGSGMLPLEGSERVYLENADDYAIESVTYTVDNEKVEVDQYGNLSIKEGATVTAGETVKVTAAVRYYKAEDVYFQDGFEGEEKKFATNATGYKHSSVNSLWGRYAATPSTTKGTATKTFDTALTDCEATVWFYDPNKPAANKEKFLIALSGSNVLGVMNTTESKYVDGMLASNYACKLTGISYGTYCYGATTNIKRSAGWHKFQWIIDSEKGLTVKIDDTIVATHSKVVKTVGANTATTIVEDYANVKSASSLALSNGWMGTSGVSATIVDKFFVDGVTVVKKGAETETVSVETEIAMESNAPTVVEPEFSLVYGTEEGYLAKDGTGRVYLENINDFAIENVSYTVDNEKVKVDDSGNLTLDADAVLEEGETVTVTAHVDYYTSENTLFADNFEGDAKFTDGTEGIYLNSQENYRFGRNAAKMSGSGIALKNLEATDATVTMWFYDGNKRSANNERFLVAVNGTSKMGVMNVSRESAYVDGLLASRYATILPGASYDSYCYGATTNVERSKGWHKFEWIIDSEKGMTVKIDGTTIETHNGVTNTAGANTELITVTDYAQLKNLTNLQILNSWPSYSGSFLVDGVAVVKNGAVAESIEVQSVEIPLKNLGSYEVYPSSFAMYSNFAQDKTLMISPNMEDYGLSVSKVMIGETKIDPTLWSAKKGEAPKNTDHYPNDLQLTLDKSVFEGLSAGEHTITIIDGEGTEIKSTVITSQHTPTNYYLSNNNGDDQNDGNSAETPWKSIEKLQSVTFGPDDRIYLDAESVWSGVWFRPQGSGTEGHPIIMTKYNDGGDRSKRPILNGDGTGIDGAASAVIQLKNVEQWEVRGIEVTNYEQIFTAGAVQRTGIMVHDDYREKLGLETTPATAKEQGEAAFRSGQLKHIVIEDCYIHDVVAKHPAVGGNKTSCSIRVAGYFDDIRVENNIAAYNGVTGIRVDGPGFGGSDRTGRPLTIKNLSVSNNFIVAVPCDGMVISCAKAPLIENNYLTDAGYSYQAVSATETESVREMGNRTAPITMGTMQYAGFWCIGTEDALYQYNEVVNNVWNCSDGEAFDADIYTKGLVFQYNYTYRNNGGFFLSCLSDGSTVVRYNVSVEDGTYLNTDCAHLLFNTSGTGQIDAIHNNLFILSSRIAQIIRGTRGYFYNNIFLAPNGLHSSFTYSSTAQTSDSGEQGEVKNNIFYPAMILDKIKTSSAIVENNITLSEDELATVFEDLEGFIDAQPVKALLGRSELTGTVVENLENGKGAGVAVSPEGGRSIQTPIGGLDLAQFKGIRLAEGSPAIGKGTTDWDYEYKATTDEFYPLEKDFFGHDITGLTSVDIGPYQSSVHNVVTTPSEEATCTESGCTEGAHCENCGMVFKEQEIIPALGHHKTVSDGTIVCERCGEGALTLDMANATLLLKRIDGHDVELTDLQADVSGDGKVSVFDAVRFLQLMNQNTIE